MCVCVCAKTAHKGSVAQAGPGGASWLAEVHELRAEQLQQSLTIAVSG